MNGNSDQINFKNLPLLGFLQRIAVCYLFSELTKKYLARCEVKSRENNDDMTNFQQHLEKKRWKDFEGCGLQWAFVILLQLFYVFMAYIVDFQPDLNKSACPKGYTGPGGISGPVAFKFFNCTGGNFQFIDVKIFGENRFLDDASKILNRYPVNSYQFKWAHAYYYGGENNSLKLPAFTNNNLLSFLQSCVTSFLGMQMGKIFQSYKTRKGRISRIIFWIVNCLVIFGFTQFSILDNFFKIPINAHIYSISYCFLSSAISFFILLIFYICYEITGGEHYFMIRLDSQYSPNGRQRRFSITNSIGAKLYQVKKYRNCQNGLYISKEMPFKYESLNKFDDSVYLFVLDNYIYRWSHSIDNKIEWLQAAIIAEELVNNCAQNEQNETNSKIFEDIYLDDEFPTEIQMILGPVPENWGAISFQESKEREIDEFIMDSDLHSEALTNLMRTAKITKSYYNNTSHWSTSKIKNLNLEMTILKDLNRHFIVIYIAHQIFLRNFLFNYQFNEELIPKYFSFMIMNFIGVLVWCFVAGYLSRMGVKKSSFW